MSITFYYNPMSSAARIHLSLDELGIPYEKVLIDLQAKDQKRPEFLALNPNGKVPTIVIDGQPMFESIAIQIYLGERFGVERGLWPALGSREHMQALTWLCWHQSELAVPLFSYLQQVSAPAEQRNNHQLEANLAEAHQMLAILDTFFQWCDEQVVERSRRGARTASGSKSWGRFLGGAGRGAHVPHHGHGQRHAPSLTRQDFQPD